MPQAKKTGHIRHRLPVFMPVHTHAALGYTLSLCDLYRRQMNLFHLLLLLLDHLTNHLSTDRTCLTGRQISVVAVL